MIEIKNFKPRLYQESILNTAKDKNTLIVLPTGLGKTKTSILIAIKRLNDFAESKVLFLTSTKPLADQISKEFRESTNLDKNGIILLTGMINPVKRQELWKDAVIIVSTPQGCFNDVVDKKINLNDVSLLIIDEAHRAIGAYDYVNIVKLYLEQAKNPRIIGLTASPGSNYQKVLEICKNLNIEDIEARTHSDDDVKPYIQEVKIDMIKVSLPDEFKLVKACLEKSLINKVESLKKWGLVGSNQKKVSKKQLLDTQKRIQGELKSGVRDVRLWQGASLISEALKLQYSIEMLESQGAFAANKYMGNIFESADTTKIKSIKSLVKDANFKEAYVKLNKLIENNLEHPKLLKLKEIIKEELLNYNAKIIVFSQYRDSASTIEKLLNNIGIKSKLFVGQAKKNGIGLTQKEQINILDEFKQGLFNVLVATNIAEEGLDIISVDLVIFYEAVPSAIRRIQRKGRTARQTSGKVIMLVTEKTTDEAYHWISHRKEKQMNNIIKNLKEKLKTTKQKTLL